MVQFCWDGMFTISTPWPVLMTTFTFDTFPLQHLLSKQNFGHLPKISWCGAKMVNLVEVISTGSC